MIRSTYGKCSKGILMWFSQSRILLLQVQSVTIGLCQVFPPFPWTTASHITLKKWHTSLECDQFWELPEVGYIPSVTAPKVYKPLDVHNYCIWNCCSLPLLVLAGLDVCDSIHAIGLYWPKQVPFLCKFPPLSFDGCVVLCHLFICHYRL